MRKGMAGRKSNRVYPDGLQPGGNVGGFQGSGTGCRPSAGGVFAFCVGLVLIVATVIITSYSILSNEKNTYGMAAAANGTIFLKHISQSPVSQKGQARVGIHNADPLATLEITTHGDDVNQDPTTLRLSRVIGESAVTADITRSVSSSVEFGYYSVSGKTQTWVAGAQVSSDVHSGSLRLVAGKGTTNATSRRRMATTASSSSSSSSAAAAAAATAAHLVSTRASAAASVSAPSPAE